MPHRKGRPAKGVPAGRWRDSAAPAVRLGPEAERRAVGPSAAGFNSATADGRRSFRWGARSDHTGRAEDPAPAFGPGKGLGRPSRLTLGAFAAASGTPIGPEMSNFVSTIPGGPPVPTV